VELETKLLDTPTMMSKLLHRLSATWFYYHRCAIASSRAWQKLFWLW